MRVGLSRRHWAALVPARQSTCCLRSLSVPGRVPHLKRTRVNRHCRGEGGRWSGGGVQPPEKWPFLLGIQKICGRGGVAQGTSPSAPAVQATHPAADRHLQQRGSGSAPAETGVGTPPNTRAENWPTLGFTGALGERWGRCGRLAGPLPALRLLRGYAASRGGQASCLSRACSVQATKEAISLSLHFLPTSFARASQALRWRRGPGARCAPSPGHGVFSPRSFEQGTVPLSRRLWPRQLPGSAGA